jgi:O-antigen/teichoic acid export membrane protein
LLQDHSVQSRFTFSFLSNGLRGLLTVATSVIIARGLGPDDYGVFTFLFGSFLAFRVLLGMGSENAFYTFLSQKVQTKQFFIFYFCWQVIQLLLPILMIGLLLPETWVDWIWLHQERGVIILVFVAVFIKQNAWQTLVFVAESFRLTNKIQTWSLIISAIHLVALLLLWRFSTISLIPIICITIVEYLIALVLAWRGFGTLFPGDLDFDWKELWWKYYKYCLPLAIFSVLGFGNGFADNWLLQNYGGPVQQAFFGISQQMSVVVLLASSSFINIFWKEISEAQHQGNQERLKLLYQKSIKLFFFIGASICGFLIPWSKEIISLFLGETYLECNSVLAIMLLQPIFASLGQISGAFLLATSQTKAQVKLGSIVLGISIPLSFFIQANENSFLPGLSLGAVGMALKYVGFTAIGANLFNWWIAKSHGWKIEWRFQLIGLSGFLAIGWLAYQVPLHVMPVIELNMYLHAGIALLFYIILAVGFLLSFPEVAGLTRKDIVTIPQKLLGKVRIMQR